MLRACSRRFYQTKNFVRYFSPSSSLNSSNLLIRNGTVVNADREFKADVYISDGKIVNVVEDNTIPIKLSKKFEVIDASGKYVIPGGIDPHVHLEMPFMGTTSVDGYMTGTRAALAGGTTCLIDFIIPKKGQDLVEAYDEWASRAEGEACCDYSFHCAITYWDPATIPADMERLVKERGINSFKVFLAYKGSLQVLDNECLNILESAKKVGAVTMAHCEHADLIEHGQQEMVDLGVLGPEGHYWSRTEEVEAEATHRMITLAGAVRTPLYVVHVMSSLAADEVARGKQKGHIVFGETLASTLGVDGRNYYDKDWRKAAGFVMSPPLNPDPKVKQDLMRRVSAKQMDVIATDNCTFRTNQKMMGKDSFTKIPNGVNGIEDRLSVVWNNGVRAGLLSPSDFVNATSTQAARIFNMYPRKGVIGVGSDADVVVWDGAQSRMVSRHTHHHGVDFNIFEGQELYGVADTTISGGVIKWRYGKSTNADIEMHRGSGQLLTRPSFGHAFSRVAALDQTFVETHQAVDRSALGGKGASSHASSAKPSRPVKSGAVCPLTAPPAHSMNPGHLPSFDSYERGHGEARHDTPHATSTTTPAAALPASAHLTSLESVLWKYIPEGRERDEVSRLIFGAPTYADLAASNSSADSQWCLAQQKATRHRFDLPGVFSFQPSAEEQTRARKITRVAAIQNAIVLPTDRPVVQQKHAIFDKIGLMIDTAAHSGANVVCLQECWTSPFFMCTRERYPWVEFAEDPTEGESALFIRKLAREHNMVIISPILEKDKMQGVLHNTAVVFDNKGDVLGMHRKNHIPRVHDFNESSYYMEGNDGHPVFDTEFGKIGVNICYGRHHPLNWLAFGLNGAEIVFNPCATVDGLSEHLWSVEARCAAIANNYFSVAINRVGTETFPREFSSGDGKPAHKDFGQFFGSSYITAPTGERTPGLSRVNDGLLLADCDLNLCDQVKQKWQFQMTSRLPMYAEILNDFAKKL